MDVVIAAGKILRLMDPSKTASFVDSIRTSQVTVLPISVQDQLIIPGLIDVHVHAIGGGGEQGLLSKMYLLYLPTASIVRFRQFAVFVRP